jgi:membrane protein YdbS with pleckstrin-like domain
MLDPQHSLRLDPSTVMLWRMQRLIRMVLVGIPTLIAIGIAASTVMRTELVVVAVMTLIAMNIVFTLFWPAFEYNAFRYMVREDDLLVQSGVIFRRWSSIPHNRIQHVDTRQGPIERVFGLSRLLVFTAAGMSADGSIPGLATDDAERLRDQLSRRGGDDGV